MSRRLMIAAPLVLPIPAVRARQTADDVRVPESMPAANADFGRKSSDEVIEHLHPRLESAPEVPFAAAPTLPPGDCKLHWAVITLQGTKAIEGDIPFEVSNQPSQ